MRTFNLSPKTFIDIICMLNKDFLLQWYKYIFPWPDEGQLLLMEDENFVEIKNVHICFCSKTYTGGENFLLDNVCTACDESCDQGNLKFQSTTEKCCRCCQGGN